MKVKAIAVILFAAVAALSCGEKQLTPDPGSTGPLPGKIVLKNNQTEFSFERQGGNGQVTFSTNRAWKARSSQAWITVDPTSGKAGIENSFTFSVSANPNYQDAKAILSIVCGNTTKEFTITQAGYGLRSGKPKLLLAGDSICTNYDESAAPQTGWGQCIGAALGQNVEVINGAVGGESTKSFIDEGKWDALIAQADSGDIVCINFGHNDEKTDAAHATTLAAYKTNLTKFVTDIRQKGASPVMITPMSRRNFSEEGVLKRTHGDYPFSMIQAAEAARTPLIDIESLSFNWLSELGPEASDQYYVTNKRGGDDNTHLTDLGAQVVAAWIADGLKNVGLWVY